MKYIQIDSPTVVEFDESLDPSKVGTTYKDFNDGKYIEVNKEMEDYIEENPEYDVKEMAKKFLPNPVKYLHNSSSNIPILFNKELDETLYSIGINWEDYTLGKYIKITDDMQTFSDEHDGATAREIIEMCMDDDRKKTEEEIKQELAAAKYAKIEEITRYDSSDEVNCFYIGEDKYWLDKATRVGLVNSTNMEIEVGREETTLILGDKVFTYPCKTVINMLAQVEVYAKDCYNVTAQHKNAVNALETKTEVKAYDYTTNYPEKLHFD